MNRKIPERLLVDLVTVKKPVQSFVGATKRPVFEFQTAAAGVKARFNPANVALNRNVLGQTSKEVYTVFINPVDLKENDRIIREKDGKEFVITEVKDFFDHHLEVIVEEHR